MGSLFRALLFISLLPTACKPCPLYPRPARQNAYCQLYGHSSVSLLTSLLILNIPLCSLSCSFTYRSVSPHGLSYLASVTQKSIHNIRQCAFWIRNCTVCLVPCLHYRPLPIEMSYIPYNCIDLLLHLYW